MFVLALSLFSLQSLQGASHLFMFRKAPMLTGGIKRRANGPLHAGTGA